MTTIQWQAYANSDCDSFIVYRAVTGFTVTFPNSLAAGDVLTFSATSSTIQNITLDPVDIDSVIAQINSQGKGVSASKVGTTKIIVRATATTNPKLKLYACTFATNTSLTPQTFLPALTFSQLATVPRLTGTDLYVYNDLDGSPLDYYRITSVLDSVESLPSVIVRPVISPEPICAVEGRITDAQNNPVVNAKVEATISVPPASAVSKFIIKTPITTHTDIYGRFNLPLVQSQLYLLNIPAIGYNKTIETPDAPSVGLLDLIPTLEARFTPFEDPV